MKLTEAAGVPPNPGKNVLRNLIVVAGLIAVLAILFSPDIWNSTKVLFSNDGPVGGLLCSVNKMPGILAGIWADSNWLGGEYPGPSPDVTTLLRLVMDPVHFARFYCPAALIFAGLCAFLCFRRLKLSPIACLLGALAVLLNSDFFSTACWGVASQIIGFGANFLAIAFLAESSRTGWKRWAAVVLAGLAVGMGVMEAYDIGALFSLFVAAYALYQPFLEEGIKGAAIPRLGRGIFQVIIMGVFAAMVATHVLNVLFATQIKHVAGMAQDEKTRSERWSTATQFSVPKKEILQVFVPGLFGYRDDWYMYENASPKEDKYWGSVGEDPSVPDARENAASSDPNVSAAAKDYLKGVLWRLSGTGFYSGVLVWLVALWAALQSFRKNGSPYSDSQRRTIKFWLLVLVVAALFSFGRYAPFYQLFYALPYMSTIRNPAKFMHIFSWTLLIVFAYGVHGLVATYMTEPVNRARGLVSQFRGWLARAGTFEHRWTALCVVAIPASLVAWMIYASAGSSLQAYMQTVGIPADDAPQVASFSQHAVLWFILFLTLAVLVLSLVMSGQFAGPRAKWGALLMGLLLFVDLGRADRPWIMHWDMSTKYAKDPIIDFLADKPYEHRVAMLPIGAISQEHAMLHNIYANDWKQHLFLAHDIQCADIVQEPRVTEDKMIYMAAMRLSTLPAFRRFWELTATRYILAPGGNVLSQLGPEGQHYRVLKSFDLVEKAGTQGPWPEDQVSQLNPNGQLAVLELTNALHRATLFSNWQVDKDTNNTLYTLTSPDFDPHQKVLVMDDLPAPAPGAAGKSAGNVTITHYEPMRIELDADAATPAVLLLCDRYSDKWEATVDGKPQKILRCNFIERGLYLQPGSHKIVFRFVPAATTFLASTIFAIPLFLGILGLFCLTPFAEAGPKPARPAKG